MKIAQCDDSIQIITDTQEDMIEDFILLLRKWNGLNLISKNTVQDIWKWHILDGLSILCLLDSKLPIVDFGAGGGVIGVPLVYLGYDVLFTERSEIKGLFLQDILNMKVHIGSDVVMKEKFIAVVRGVGKIKDILQTLGENVIKVIFLKSSLYRYEIIDAARDWAFDYKTYNRVSVHGKIVVLTNIRRKTLFNSN